MSVEFYLREGSLDRKGWNQVLSDWNEQIEEELYDEPEFDDEDDQPYVRISGPGSTRGFSLSLTEEGAHIRLDALASRDDWRRCYSLCAAAVKKGGGMLEREDGQIYAKPRLVPEHAIKDCDEDFVFTAKALRAQIGESDDGKGQLPCGYFNLFVSADDLTGDVPTISARLAERFERYGTAYRPTMLFTDQQGKTGVTYGPVPTILPKSDFVVMPNVQDESKTRMIAWNDLCQSLGALAEDVGDGRIYVPDPADFSDDIKRKIARVAKPVDPSNVTPQEGTGDQSGKGDELGSVLISAPFAALLLVAGSDGTIEAKELKAAFNAMMAYIESEQNDQTVRAIFMGCIQESDAVMKQVLDNPIGPLALLVQVRAAMEHHLDRPTQARFIKAIMDVATAAASATGGLLGMFGSKISKDEQDALDLLRALLEGKKR